MINRTISDGNGRELARIEYYDIVNICNGNTTWSITISNLLNSQGLIANINNIARNNGNANALILNNPANVSIYQITHQINSHTFQFNYNANNMLEDKYTLDIVLNSMIEKIDVKFIQPQNIITILNKGILHLAVDTFCSRTPIFQRLFQKKCQLLLGLYEGCLNKDKKSSCVNVKKNEIEVEAKNPYLAAITISIDAGGERKSVNINPGVPETITLTLPKFNRYGILKAVTRHIKVKYVLNCSDKVWKIPVSLEYTSAWKPYIIALCVVVCLKIFYMFYVFMHDPF
ncbi:MAG: hypothetical protein AB7U45_06230 [Desulfamplus sp.]